MRISKTLVLAYVLFAVFDGKLLVKCSTKYPRSAKYWESPGDRETRDDGVLVDERVVMGYSDSWVLEVEGGRDEADRLADEYGFVNLGQVRECLDVSCLPLIRILYTTPPRS